MAECGLFESLHANRAGHISDVHISARATLSVTVSHMKVWNTLASIAFSNAIEGDPVEDDHDHDHDTKDIERPGDIVPAAEDGNTLKATKTCSSRPVQMS